MSETRSKYPDILHSLLICLLFLFLSYLMGFVIGLIAAFFGFSFDSPQFMAGIALSTILTASVIIFIACKVNRLTLRELFPITNPPLPLWLATFSLALGLIIIASEINNIVVYFFPLSDFWREIFEMTLHHGPLYLIILNAAIIPAIFEELVFRGVICRGLRLNYSPVVAIIVSSLLFGVIHMNPWQLVSGFVIGLSLAWIYVKTDTLSLCIFVHFVNNLLYVLANSVSHVFSIKGFNPPAVTAAEFQPLWFNLLGIVLFSAGIFSLSKLTAKCRAG